MCHTPHMTSVGGGWVCTSLFGAFGAAIKRDYAKGFVSDPKGTPIGIYAMHAINQGGGEGRTIDSSTHRLLLITIDNH